MKGKNNSNPECKHMSSLTSTFPKYLAPSGGPVVLTPWLLWLAGWLAASRLARRSEVLAGGWAGIGRGSLGHSLLFPS